MKDTWLNCRLQHQWYPTPSVKLWDSTIQDEQTMRRIEWTLLLRKFSSSKGTDLLLKTGVDQRYLVSSKHKKFGSTNWVQISFIKVAEFLWYWTLVKPLVQTLLQESIGIISKCIRLFSSNLSRMIKNQVCLLPQESQIQMQSKVYWPSLCLALWLQMWLNHIDFQWKWCWFTQ